MSKKVRIKVFGIIACILFVCPYTASSKEYRICKLWNCKSIKIGEKTMTVGNTFRDEMVIHWTNARQLMEVQDVSTGKVFKIAQKGFEKNKAKTLLDLLTKENSMGSRSFKFGERHYTEIDHYLADSLHFPIVGVSDSNTIIEAIWDCDGEKIITPIQRTSDGKFYIITPAIYGNKKPRDIKLNIRERERGHDWTDNVYHDIPIIYIPTR